ncbi:MAG: acetylornithine deacetylase [Candidatus Marinimicrobia bacterium]|nr:acetylornithine deacetylase [Candidatus Neomarinimicrobiota bacterium]|tara:strand:- start:1133 stop:2647 length:1515 start_codon:yes stop_codon:yes gene_type:complete
MINKIIFITILSLQFTFSQTLNMNEINTLSREKAQDVFKEYREFLSLPNDANKPDELEPNMLWCEKAFKKRGFTTERLKTKRLPLILAEREHPGAKKTVLFYIQIDGQPVDPSKWLQKGPFVPTLKKQIKKDDWEAIPWESLYDNYDDDWRIFARSASDAKGPINTFLIALDIIADKGILPNYNIKVIMDMEEEMGSPNLPPAVKRYKNKLKADRLVILDGPRHPSNKPTLTFGARGIVTIQLKVQGPKFPQHSGHYGNYVPNPAVRLSQLIASMKDDNGKVTIPGYYDGVTISEEARSIMSAVPDDEDKIRRSIGFSKPDQVANTYQESIQYPSLNVRGMKSGWVEKEVRTIIPSFALAEIDVRLVKETDPKRMVKLIKNHIKSEGYYIIDRNPTDSERAKHNKIITFNHRIGYLAFRTPVNSEIADWLRAALINGFGEEPIIKRTSGGSVPISPFVNTLNVPAVTVPTVNPDNNQHSPNENLRVGNLIESVRTHVALLIQPY